ILGDFVMRQLIALAFFTTFATAAHAETILATVKGMVCAFCATGIEKTFKKQAAVDTVHVDLKSKLVTINTKPQQNIDDATITQLLKNAGYTVAGIERK